MCSRYKLTPDPKELGRLLDVEWKFDWEASRIVRPSELAPVIVGGFEGIQLQWGFTRANRRGPTGDSLSLINARSETAADKPMFRDAFRKRRCIIPAAEYYEWREEWSVRPPPVTKLNPAQTSLFGDDLELQKPVPETRPETKRLMKQRYRFSFVDDAPLWIAGIWEPGDGSEARCGTFAVLTTEANAVAREVHPRMPCILDESALEAWLDSHVQSSEALQELIRPVDAIRMMVRRSD